MHIVHFDRGNPEKICYALKFLILMLLVFFFEWPTFLRNINQFLSKYTKLINLLTGPNIILLPKHIRANK